MPINGSLEYDSSIYFASLHGDRIARDGLPRDIAARLISRRRRRREILDRARARAVFYSHAALFARC